MNKFGILILILILSGPAQGLSKGPACAKSPMSQVINTYPEICRSNYEAGQCEKKIQNEIAQKKTLAIQENWSQPEIKNQLDAVKSRYSKCSREEYEEAAQARTKGCLIGAGQALKDLILGAPEMLVEKMEEAKACRDDLQTKLRAINETNQILGDKNRLELVSQSDLTKTAFDAIRRSRQFITKEELARISCLELDQKIRHHKAKAWNDLTTEEKNMALLRINATIPPSVMESVKQMLAQMGLPSNCLAPKAYWEAVCLGSVEIASVFAGGGLAAFKALRMARLSKLTGKSAKELEKKLAELQGLGREARIAKAGKEIRNLTGAQKAKLLQEEMGLKNPLNSQQMKAVEKAHLEGSTRGEGYGTYTGNTLREKKRILMKEGGFSELQVDYMINRGVVGVSTKSTAGGSLTIEKVRTLTNEPTRNRLLGEMTSQNSRIRNGVVENPEAQRYFQEAGKSMEAQIEKSSASQIAQSEAKRKMANIEVYVIDKKLNFPKERPELAARYSDFERNVVPIQRQFEEAATNYIRAGKKDEALRILNKSPVVSNLSNGTGKQNYIQMFLQQAEVSRIP